MFKRAIATILLIIVAAGIIISSWNYTSNKIRIFPDNFGSQGVEIQKREGYKINTMHPYEMIETDDGYDLIIHFVKE